MPGTTIGINMTYGYPGQASRQGDEVSRTRPVAAGAADIPFGAPVIQKEDGSVALFGATNTADDFAGIAMRKVKSAKVYPYQNFGYYTAGEPCDVLQRGGISATCAWGTAKVGDLGAANETGNCIELKGVKWSSGADARSVAELTIITRQGV